MFKLPRLSPSLHLSAIALTTLLTGVASGQAAPQLLPYTTRLIAGGGGSTPAKGATCPLSGYIATDAYGDGCLATEVLLGTSATAPGARAAVADSAGNVFFGDYVNGVIHRVDLLTGVMTAVVGGAATSPASGTTCGSTVSTDAKGDGCLATLVHLSHPTAVIFAPNGDLYFADYGYGQVRKVALGNQSVASAIVASAGSGYTSAPTVTFSAAPGTGTTATGTATISNGVVTGITITNPGSGYTSAPTVTLSAPASGTTATAVAVDTGIVSLVAGSATGTFGYNVSIPGTSVIAATQSVLDGPYGLAFDNQGDLIIADEYTAAVLAVNLNATGTTTVNNVQVPAGQIWKIAGTVSSGGPYCVNGTGSTAGCTYNHAYTEGTQATSDYLRNAYGLAADTLGNIFITNEYYDTIQKVASTGVLTTYVGTQNTGGKSLTRGTAPNIAIGSPFGVATDPNNNLYFTDAADGTVWRVDANTQSQYLIGSGFGSSGTGFASTTLPGPGIFSISADANANVYFGDTEKNTITEIASGAQFGVVGANHPIDTLDIHFGAGDSPSPSTPYTLTTGASNFSLGTASCTYNNSDSTTDCLLPVTANPTVLGPFTSNLQVKSALGTSSSFAITGIYVQSPVTSTSVTYAAGIVCTGTTTYATGSSITLTANLLANGPSAPTGTIAFYANSGTGNTLVGTTQNVTNLGTTTAPVYGAKLVTTFATPGIYTFTAVYSGDSYFKTSTGVDAVPLTTSTPGFVATPTIYAQSSVVAGQTALYSFTLSQSVYTGTITMSCAGLPANSSCVFSPSSIVATGCTASSTVAVNILTQQAGAIAGFSGGRGIWSLLSMSAGLLLALAVTLRRRSGTFRHHQLWMIFALLLTSSGAMGCSAATSGAARTPAGSYTVTITATGSTGITSSFPVSLNVQ